MLYHSTGESLITNGHYAEQEIQARLDGLDTLWKQLQDSSLLKKERLQEAYQVSIPFCYCSKSTLGKVR